MILILFLLFSSSVYASDNINLDIISQIESSGNANAYNSQSGAVGMYQITPICLKDYNGHHKPQRSMNDMKDRLISKNVANWYLNHRIPTLLEAYNIEDTIENRLWAYNAGIGNVKRGIKPKETKNYIKKYKRLSWKS